VRRRASLRRERRPEACRTSNRRYVITVRRRDEPRRSKKPRHGTRDRRLAREYELAVAGTAKRRPRRRARSGSSTPRNARRRQKGEKIATEKQIRPTNKTKLNAQAANNANIRPQAIIQREHKRENHWDRISVSNDSLARSLATGFVAACAVTEPVATFRRAFGTGVGHGARRYCPKPCSDVGRRCASAPVRGGATPLRSAPSAADNPTPSSADCEQQQRSNCKKRSP
jgi:hypothetical protein